MADDITDKLAARLEELERGLKKSRRQFGRTAERSRDHLEREWDALKADISDLLDSDSLADRPEVRAALNRHGPGSAASRPRRRCPCGRLRPHLAVADGWHGRRCRPGDRLPAVASLIIALM